MSGGKIRPAEDEIFLQVQKIHHALRDLQEEVRRIEKPVQMRVVVPPIHKKWPRPLPLQAVDSYGLPKSSDRPTMDYISAFDIRLAKDVYYAGENVSGSVLLENTENIKIKGIRVLLRGKVHATLKVVKSGERRTMKDDQYIIDEKVLAWGKDKNEECESLPILARGLHQMPFSFALPQSTLPCSLESRHGTIRYYIKVIIDIPYASSPQGIKYFTIIGPHIDCMEEKYLAPLTGQDRKVTCCLCCQRGALALRVTLDRTAYVCGENIRVRAQVENRQSSQQVIKVVLTQHVEYFIEKGVLGENKSISCTVFEHKSSPISANSQGKYDSTLEQPIRLPVVPPTLIGACRLIQIYYILRACLEDEKGNENLILDFPLTVATVPYRIPNGPMPPVEYEYCSNHVEGGKYVSPEFRLGQVYDGENEDANKEDEVVLYRPIYAKLSERRIGSPQYGKDLRSGSFTKIHDSCQSIITESNGGRRRSVALQSPLLGEQSLSKQNLRAESEDDPLLKKA